MLLASTRHPASATAPTHALPLVLIHGLGGTQYAWDPIVAPLRELGEVITIDLPGFGRSPEPDEWSLEGAADEIAETLDDLDVDRHVLVGHSLGGGVCITYAASRPERVTKLGLVSPAGFLGTGDGSVSRGFAAVHLVWRTVLRLGPAKLLRYPRIRDRVFAALVHDTSVIGIPEAEEMARGAAQGRSTVAARSAIYAANLFARLPKLVMPVALVWGRDDRIVPFTYAECVAAKIPDVTTTFLDEVGHMAMWERTDETVAAIRVLVAR